MKARIRPLASDQIKREVRFIFIMNFNFQLAMVISFLFGW